MYNKLEEHPIKKLFDKKIKITLNTDNRTVSNITLNETYEKLKNSFKFTDEDFIIMNKNAIQSAFINDFEKKELESLLIK